MAKSPVRTIVHVNRQYIAFNAKHGKPVLPTYIIRRGSQPPVYAHAFKMIGTLEGIDPREKSQLKCGARAWLETTDQVIPVEPMTWKEAEAIRKSLA